MTTAVKKYIGSSCGIFILFIALGALPLLAQNHEERVTIEGAYRPTIKDFDKIYIKPEAPETAFPPADTSISTLERYINSKAELEMLSPLPPRDKSKYESYNNFWWQAWAVACRLCLVTNTVLRSHAIRASA